MSYFRHLYSVVLFILLGVGAAFALPMSYYSGGSIMSTGRWARVDVDTTGIFEISYDRLRELGFSDPSRVAVYGYGGVESGNMEFSTAVPDDLCPAAFMHTSDGRVLFYGEGDLRLTPTSTSRLDVKRNYYSTTGSYFLSDVPTDPAVLRTAFDESASSILLTHTAIAYIEREIQNPCDGGYVFHGPELHAGESESFTFNIADYESASGNATFRFNAGINPDRKTTMLLKFSDNAGTVSTSVKASGTNTVAARYFIAYEGSATLQPQQTASLAGADITATLTLPSSFSGNYCAIDNAYVMYPRNNILRDGVPALEMNFIAVTSRLPRIRIAVPNPDIVVWNIVNPVSVTAPQTVYDSNEQAVYVSIPIAKVTEANRLIAFDPLMKQRSPVGVEIVDNQNLHAIRTPEMLIFTTSSLRDAAEELAEIHRSIQGMDVEVVEQTDVFNEFSSGVKHPAALRRFAKMLYDREPGKLRYILLYGPACWDNRGIVENRGESLVDFECDSPEYARSVATNYAADLFFGMLDDSYVHSNIVREPTQVSVGRIPAINISVARDVNAKILDLLANPRPSSAFLRVLKSSDDGDLGQHLAHSEEFADKILASNMPMTITRADNCFYPFKDSEAQEAQKLIEQSLKDGRGLFFYTGHGGDRDLSSEKIYSLTAVEEYAYDCPPLVFFASCDTYPFSRHSQTLVENMVFKRGGGALGAIGACRSVYLDQNRIFSLAFGEAYAAARPGDTGADLMRYARNNLIAGGYPESTCLNAINFNYCGDPAIPLSVPEYGIEIEAIDAIRANSNVDISARVVDGSGKTLTDFNGKVIFRLNDAPVPLRKLIRDEADGDTLTVFSDEKLLIEFPANVVNGIINCSTFVPLPAAFSSSNSIVAVATDDATGKSAAGKCVTVIKDATEVGPDVDMSAPSILEFYIAPENYIGADAVSASFDLCALIDPSATGLALSENSIRKGLEINLDGVQTFPEAKKLISYTGDGLAYVRLPIKNLSHGRHTLTLTVENNIGEFARESMMVMVSSAALRGDLVLDQGKTVRDEATFNLVNMPSACSARLVVHDNKGNTVFSAENCTFPYAWNLCDKEGKAVEDGMYSAFVILSNEFGYGSTEKISFVVIK